ncbi:hypothetical protein GCM10027034_16360 [Ramlibacter solisilvae]|uniref:ATP-grasp domain-containing protein n=1 Tax=Ramlibacter tataouinensis TaxID=94132 RepID=A0A127JVY8_9BURK|nr:hypothetical protein [Ramlibacter tataouinensis]AMO24176.1 hypothetical protein UC35_16695 [Ramlibacter tataouinensis]
MFFLTGYLNHAASIQAATAEFGIKARMDLANFSLELGKSVQRRVWKPRFVGAAQGRTAYIDRMGPNTRGFAGWLPYDMRRWPVASDKAEFKKFAASKDVPTPAACTDASAIGGPFLIKKFRSSFGEGIRGPFLKFDPGQLDHALRDGEYYENFILGHIVKAWYWGSTWGAIEVRQPPVVTGDGHTPLRALVQAKLDSAPDRPHDWQALSDLARYCGVQSLDDVPAPSREVLIDFKYGSRYEPTSRANRNVIDKLRATPLASQFERAGEVFSHSITDYGDASLFTLDAMVDSEGTVWFLEMNSNPMVHPDLYPLVLRDQFDAARARLPLAA